MIFSKKDKIRTYMVATNTNSAILKFGTLEC